MHLKLHIFQLKNKPLNPLPHLPLYYNLNVFTEAAQRFEDCLVANPGDRVAQIYLKRCQAKIEADDVISNNP
ncbi:MAG TPA: hypothetical protein DCL61_00510 [Cyanobacteria bacterium UBA12227]|nr:hypothetical protein [Cyanobacteria bacterium UBA12227]HBY80457.1 hypothetical protein [Cyanobacteria bacterium UBA11148]